MRFWTAVILLIILETPFLLKVSLVTDYIVRWDYYAKVLCENKDRPELHCDGKCILAQKMAAADATTPDKPLLPEFLTLEFSPFLQAQTSLQLMPILLNGINEQLYFQHTENCSSGFLQLPSPPPKGRVFS